MSRAAGMQEHRRLALPGQSDLNVEYRLHVVSAGREDGEGPDVGPGADLGCTS
jgi:hypothetical protein